MLTFLLSALKVHWLKVVVVAGFLLLVFGSYVKGYYKGKNEAEARMAQQYIEWQIERDKAVEAERAKIRRLQDRIHSSRQTDPINDARDSCLLSNNPFEVDCLKEGK